MKLTKKFLSVLLCMMLVLSFCAAASAETASEEPVQYTSGNYTYILLPDGTAEITNYSVKETDLTVPDTLDGYSVTSIGDRAFSFCDSLTSVSIPEGVTSIGDEAFSACWNLTSVSIPDSVTSIGANPFIYCSKLTSIFVSKDHPLLETIDGVLFDKQSKTLICYPCAFEDASYEIPQGILAIGDGAFADCYSLTSVSIPDSVTSIGANPFIYCSKLTSILVSKDHPLLATIDGVLFDKQSKTLICYPCAFEDASYEIPQGILAIGDSAFFSCDSLTSVSIPDSVTSIGDAAFCYCSSLTSVSIPDSITSIGDYAFSSCDSLTSVSIPDSVTSIGDSAFYNCNNLTLAVAPSSYAETYAKENNIPYTYSRRTSSTDWLNN